VGQLGERPWIDGIDLLDCCEDECRKRVGCSESQVVSSRKVILSVCGIANFQVYASVGSNGVQSDKRSKQQEKKKKKGRS
jgi:hypothetical protein